MALAASSTTAAPRQGLVQGLDVALFVALTALGLAVRWPYLWSAPRFTDEIFEVLRGLQVAQGKLLPLTNVNSYIGAIQNYTVAMVFLATGESPWSPRLVSWLMGGLTVGLAYPLGLEIARSVGGRYARWVGVLAALMLAMAGVHVFVNSHIAWSNAVTPFYTTLGLWLVLRVIRTGTAWPLAIAGVSFGCALQTHLLAGMFLPAVLALVLWKARWLIRSPWTYAGVALFLVAFGSVILHNVINLGDTLRIAQVMRNRKNYLMDGPLPEADPFVIVRNVGRTIWMLGETLVTSIHPADEWPTFIDQALIILGLTLVTIATLWALRRGQPMPLLATLATLAILPVANPGRYTTITDARYVSPLLPLCFAVIAALALALPAARGVRWGALALLVGMFVLQPIGPMLRYGERASAEEPTNATLARSVALIRSRAQDGDVVMLDNRLNLGARNIPTLREARAAFDGFTYLLAFEDVRVITTQVSRASVEDRLRRRPRLFVIAPPGYRSELLAGRVSAVRSDDARLPTDPAAPGRPIYEIYLVERPAGAPSPEPAPDSEQVSLTSVSSISSITVAAEMVAASAQDGGLDALERGE